MLVYCPQSTPWCPLRCPQFDTDTSVLGEAQGPHGTVYLYGAVCPAHLPASQVSWKWAGPHSVYTACDRPLPAWRLGSRTRLLKDEKGSRRSSYWDEYRSSVSSLLPPCAGEGGGGTHLLEVKWEGPGSKGRQETEPQHRHSFLICNAKVGRGGGMAGD